MTVKSPGDGTKSLMANLLTKEAARLPNPQPSRTAGPEPAPPDLPRPARQLELAEEPVLDQGDLLMSRKFGNGVLKEVVANGEEARISSSHVPGRDRTLPALKWRRSTSCSSLRRRGRRCRGRRGNRPTTRILPSMLRGASGALPPYFLPSGTGAVFHCAMWRPTRVDMWAAGWATSSVSIGWTPRYWRGSAVPAGRGHRRTRSTGCRPFRCRARPAPP